MQILWEALEWALAGWEVLGTGLSPWSGVSSSVVWKTDRGQASRSGTGRKGKLTFGICVSSREDKSLFPPR